VFDVPTWSHDPSDQLNSLVGRLPGGLVDDVRELALMARELAPEHGRSSYGEPSAGLTPGDIYREDHASDALEKARRARVIVKGVLDRLNVEF